jgi:hypothetical protein
MGAHYLSYLLIEDKKAAVGVVFNPQVASVPLTFQ